MNVGDRVQVIKWFAHANYKGKTGTIVWTNNGTDPGWYDCAVEFDEYEDGMHDCRGRIPSGNGRYGNFCELRLIEPDLCSLTLKTSFEEAMAF